MMNGRKHGTFRRYYPDGYPYITRYYRQDGSDSLLECYYRNGRLKRRELYAPGRTIPDGQCYDSTGRKLKYTPFYSLPRARSGKDIFYQEVIYPQIRIGRPFVGAIGFSLIIHPDGSSGNSKIEREDPGNALHKAVREFIERLREWEPMQIDGQPVTTRVDFFFSSDDATFLSVRPLRLDELFSDVPDYH